MKAKGYDIVQVTCRSRTEADSGMLVSEGDPPRHVAIGRRSQAFPVAIYQFPLGTAALVVAASSHFPSTFTYTSDAQCG